MALALNTKIIPCTNSKPTRIKVSSSVSSKIYSYPMEAQTDIEAHIICAKQYADEKQWFGIYHIGGSPDRKGYMFVRENNSDKFSIFEK